jgi:chromosome segregation ATPase
MFMAQAMNGLVDGVLQAFQERLAAVEEDYADLRLELLAIRRDLDALRGEETGTHTGAAGLERRIARIERQLDAKDVKPSIRLHGRFGG